MNLVPKRHPHDNSLVTIPGPRGTVIMECEFLDPPSARNRTAYLHLLVPDVTDLLPELRAAGIAARQATLT